MNKGIRIINLFIDFSFITLTTKFIEVVSKNTLDQHLILLIITFFYYFIFELMMNQTLGKMVTNTKVYSQNNSEPNIKQIILRTLLRFNPFDALSYLFGKEQGSHDRFSKTYLRTTVK